MEVARRVRRLALRAGRALKGHGHHLFFALCLLSMASLLAWWTVFIRNAILQERRLLMDGLEARGRMHALLLGHGREEPRPGPCPGDGDLEIVLSQDDTSPYLLPLEPNWPQFAVRPRAEYLQSVERRFRRRSVMVVGEGSMLALLVLASTFMLYRLISVERRTACELREFWSRITHEIKTPIAGLKAFLQTLKTHDLSREELRALVDMALPQVERQQQLAQNVLIGQRLERGIHDSALEPVRLSPFISRFLQNHALLLSRCRVEFDPLEGAGLVARADPHSLHVILDNLTDNALKYGGDRPCIQVRLVAEEKRIQLRFCDRGQGFDPHLAANVFEAYKRLRHELPEGRHGTGLGLYISRELARAMGGELVAESEGPGRGACFTLFLERERSAV
jgi:signal transduction histidine kinase